MSNIRSSRRGRVVPFLNYLDKDRQSNFQDLVKKAKKFELEGFEDINWEDSVWYIKGGRLIKETGRNSSVVSLCFQYSPKLGGTTIKHEWADLIKALFLLRFHRRNQAVSNQRSFITAFSYVAYEASKQEQKIFELTPEHLDRACHLIVSHYSEGVAYNMHKSIGEFAAFCDANALCKVNFNYKFSGMRRPENVSGVGYKRLDDPKTLETKNDKLVTPYVFRIIGALYQKVPRDHHYRVYVLILTLLACLGRRFSEISLLPYQEMQHDSEGRYYLNYFPRKASQGDIFTPCRRLYLPSETVKIVEEVLLELSETCFEARKIASEMQRVTGADLSFLSDVSDSQRLYKEDLKAIGLNPQLLDSTGWLRKHGYTIPDYEKWTSQGRKPNNPFHFTTKAGVIAYCQKDFSAEQIEPIHIDQNSKKYFLKDLLLVRSMSVAPGVFSRWIATQCTHSMMSTFLRYFSKLAEEYCLQDVEVDFTSHHFRHTLNTLMDEGGLSDLLQTEWFGRTNSKDTKAYQHTSREKAALMLREDIKNDRIGGQIVEQFKAIPFTVQDAFLKARVNAVHDVGAGICIHNFAQTPCERHLQCSADCKDYVWVKGDKGREEELKRQYSMAIVARETSEKQLQNIKPKRSIDWLVHNDKKLKTLSKQLIDNNISNFDPHKYLEELTNG